MQIKEREKENKRIREQLQKSLSKLSESEEKNYKYKIQIETMKKIANNRFSNDGNKIKQLELIINNLNSNIKSNESEISNLKNIVKSKDDAINQITSQKSSYESANELLDQNQIVISAKEEEIEVLKKMLEQKNNSIKEKEKQIDDLSKIISQKEQEKQKIQESYQISLNKLNTTISTNNEAIKARDIEIKRIRSILDEKESKYRAQCESENEQLKMKFSILNQNLQNQISKKDDQIKDKILLIETLKKTSEENGKSAAMQTEALISCKDNEIKSLNEQIETQKQETKQKMNDLLNEVESLKKRIEQLNKKDEKKEVKQIQIFDSETMREYETIKELGFGSSGKVVLAAKKKYFAVKIMKTENATPKNLRYFMGEYEILNMLNHPNILKVYGICLDVPDNLPSIVLEYCPYNLAYAIKNKMISTTQIVCYIYQIAEGMRYIHFNKIIHRDLKPSNILIAEDGTIKIGDFGVSKLMSKEDLSMTTGFGTNKFMAPEIIAEEEYYDEKVDVYSFGVLLFYILTEGELPSIKVPQILQGKKEEIPSSFTEFAKNLINNCWNFDPKDRPSFKQICDQMKSNDYFLLELTASEKNNVEALIKNHQKIIPDY